MKNGNIGCDAATIKELQAENLRIHHYLSQIEQMNAALQAECATLQMHLESLEREAAMGHTLIEHFPSGIVFVFDHTLRYLEANGRATARGGIDRQALVGNTLWDTMPPEICAVLEPPSRAALGGKETTFQMSLGDGIFQMHALPVRTMQGHVIAGMLIAYDITDRIETEARLRMNQDLLQRFLDYSPGVIYMYDIQGRYLLVNTSHAQLLNRQPEQVIGKADAELFPPGTVAAWRAIDRQVIATGSPIQVEEVTRHPEGPRTFLSIKFPLYNEHGVMHAIGGISTDITARKVTESALRTSEQKFRGFIEQSTDGIVLCNNQGLIIEWNRALEQLTGIARGDALGRPMWDVQFQIAPDTHRTPARYEALRASIEELFEKEQTPWLNEVVENELQRPDGTRRTVQTRVFLIYTEKGLLMGAIVRDATEEIQTREALRAREEQFHQLIESMDDIVFTLDQEQRYTGIFGRWLERYGLLPEELLGKTPRQAPFDEATAILHEDANTRVLAGEYIVYEWSIGHPPILIQTSLSPIRSESGEITGIVGVGRDITIHKRTEAALRASEEKYRALFESVPLGLYRTTLDGQILDMNLAAIQMLGYADRDSALKTSVYNLYVNPDDRHRWQVAIERDKVVRNFEMQLRRLDGTIIWVVDNARGVRDTNGHILAYEGSIEDITERKVAEAALQQANSDLTHWVKELQQRTHEMSLLSEMGDLLQICHTPEEAASVVAQLAPRLFPFTSGALYLLSASHTYVEAMAVWGTLPIQRLFAPDACWALRRGRSHLSQDTHIGLPCQHVPDPPPQSMLCVPVMAQGKTLGVFYLCLNERTFSDTSRRLAVTVADHIGLALANLKLQETLRHQAIRDPLTGLFNRRYMEESLERELSRAKRHNTTLGIIMLNIDHFKRFNDTFGHTAGDSVLRELGAFLQSHMRGEDIACRYGGEEFMLILLDTPLSVVQQRAEGMREAIHSLPVRHHGQSLGSITCSFGIAMFPHQGTTAEELVRAADIALYQAKAQGRNKVVVSATAPAASQGTT